MISGGLAAVLIALGVVGYAYAGYPLLLMFLARVHARRAVRSDEPPRWPLISITLAMYNEQDQAAELVESLLRLDYPAERRQILIVSDGSNDGTVEIVRSYADRGVELLILDERTGKTAAENAALPHLRGSIVVNTDASIRILPDAIRPLIAAFSDPDVGLASGRDVSVSQLDELANVGESGYVGYEMWVRELETAIYGIVGASGCFYAIRQDLHRITVPGYLSRDFAAALKCEENGYRAVSVAKAVCLVPRTPSLSREYGRKVRTIARGMKTLLDRKSLLNPVHHGTFAWMLFSHKLCRWAVPWGGLLGAVGLARLAPAQPWAWTLLIIAGLGIGLGCLGWFLEVVGRRLPSLLQIPAYVLAGNTAAMHALVRTVSGRRDAIWEPTRRDTPSPRQGTRLH